MHKTIFAIVAVSVSGAALADWVKIGVTEKSTVYVDSSTIRKVGTTAKMWYTFDYRAPQQLTMNGRDVLYLSARGEDEFDCKGLRNRRVILTGNSKKKGAGGLALTNSNKHEMITAAPCTRL